MKEKFWEKIFFLNVEKNILEKKFWKKNVGKINYKTKIFITNFISTLISATLFFPSTKQGERQRKRLWYMIQNRLCRALSLDARNVVIWTKSGEKIYHGLPAVGNSLTTWAISLRRSYEILVPLALTIKRRPLNTTRKSNVIHQLSYGVEFTGVNTSASILSTFLESE